VKKIAEPRHLPILGSLFDSFAKIQKKHHERGFIIYVTDTWNPLMTLVLIGKNHWFWRVQPPFTGSRYSNFVIFGYDSKVLDPQTGPTHWIPL